MLPNFKIPLQTLKVTKAAQWTFDGARIVHESGAMFEIIHNKKDGKQ